ncbi:MAG: MmcQ/YjbR family DNA-binding protein [Bacteroidia bacterium]|nr:MmcQ/YjbR family DNA-binding protein [Bacteroidia bacterium]
MNIEELREYCLSLKGAAEDFPFDETTLVFKVGGKMFCLTDLESNLAISVKNNPEKNIELREEYPAVKPGYHMNKKYWNTIDLNGTIPDDMIKNLIDESYDLVTMSLPRKIQQEIKNR